MKQHLIIPIWMDGLVLGQAQTVAGAEADFSLLPFYHERRGIDLNADRPFLAESVFTAPFENETFRLGPGIHLHWTLPQALLRSRPISSQSNEMEFPAVPNRWYVRKMLAGNILAEWIVESDFIWPEDAGYGRNLVSVPLPSKERPFGFMGRRLTLADWKGENAEAREAHNYWRDFYNKPLTALGWGSPAFDTFYPNCHSVFGLHDSDAEPDPGLSYTVYGWYSDADPFNMAHPETLSAVFDLHCPDLKNALDGSVFFGQVFPNLAKPAPLTEAMDIAMAAAPTGTEAVSALASRLLTAADEKAKEQLEDQIEAVLFGDQLDVLRVDIGPKFRQYRHEKGYKAVDAGLHWMIKAVDRDADKQLFSDAATPKDTLPPLSPATVQALQRLNRAQDAYDKARHDMESLEAALYADWAKYLHCAYPPAGEVEDYPDADEAKAFIQFGALPAFNQLKQWTGSPIPAPAKDQQGNYLPYQGPDKTLSGEVRRCFNEMLNRIALENKKTPGARGWQITQSAAPRFWQPNAPSVVLSIEQKPGQWSPLATAGRFASDEAWLGADKNQPESYRKLPCLLLTEETSLAQDGNFSVAKIDQLVETARSSGPYKAGLNDAEGFAWSPFRVEWEAELFPLTIEHSATRKSGDFSPTFINASYVLPDNEPALSKALWMDSEHSVVRSASVYSGTAFVSPKTREHVLELIRLYFDKHKDLDKTAPAFKTVLENVLQKIQGLDLMSLTLDGFNNALLQQHRTMRMRPGDPLGSREYRDFAQKVAETLQGGLGNAPDPLLDFHPIRSGALKVRTLRIIDTFGRVYNVSPKTCTTSLPYTVPRHPDWVRMYPALAQPARLHFRWLDARTPDDDFQTEAGMYPENTPVCGWLLPNFMDRSILAFDADGKSLGSINRNGRWEPTPAKVRLITEAEVKNEANPAKLNAHLQTVLIWLLDKCANETFRNDFFQILTHALDNIHPSERAGQNALSVLMGRPLAVARVFASLEIKGKPAFNQSWNDFRADFRCKTQQSNGYTRVKFPFRLGDHHQLDDGLVGYWHENKLFEEQEDPWQNFRVVNGEDSVPFSAPALKKAKDDHPVQTIEAKPLLFTLLFDPFGKLHCTPGILPVKSIQLPASLFEEALHRMELDFLAAPILTSRQELALSLPKEEGREWSWMAKSRDRKGGRTDTGIVLEKPFVRRSRLISACSPELIPGLTPDRKVVFVEMLWTDLQALGCLTEARDPDVPDVCYANTVAIGRLALHAPAGGVSLQGVYTPGQNAAVKTMLQQLTEHIAAWSDRARFGGPAEIREGWLRLRQI